MTQCVDLEDYFLQHRARSTVHTRDFCCSLGECLEAERIIDIVAEVVVGHGRVRTTQFPQFFSHPLRSMLCEGR